MDNEKALFNVYSSDMQEYLRELNSKQKDVKKYRQKTVYAGQMLDIDIFPIWNTCKKNEVSEVRKNQEYIKKVNHDNRVRKVVQMANDNFTNDDIWITVGYKGGTEPTSRAEAERDKNNYIRRLKTAVKNYGFDELKVLGAIEVSKKGKYHIHMMTNFPDRDLAEQIWKHGKYPQARRLQLDDFGLTGLAVYVAKDLSEGKSYFATRNLTKPWQKAKVRDNKISKHKCKQIYNENINAREYFESKFPQYEFLDIEKKTSSFVEGYYFYVRMRKKVDKIISKPHTRKSKRKRE